jgi:hypothetical protein
LTISAFLSILALSYCSSLKVIRTYNENGSVKEINIIEKDNLKYKIIFEYDSGKNQVNITRNRPDEKAPVTSVRIKYDSAERIRLFSFSNSIGSGKAASVDKWVESYFYNNTGNLIKIETSYKSSYSISKNKTALITALYTYTAGNVSGIKINGGTFKKEINIVYPQKDAAIIEYKLFSINWKNKKGPELIKHFQIKLKNSNPDEGRNLAANADLKDDEAVRIFDEDGIESSINKPAFVLNYRNSLKKIDSLLVQQN